MIKIFFAFILISLGGCASIVTHSPTQKLRIQNLPVSAQVKNVPFISQKQDYCGPSTLSMVMKFHGKEISADELARIAFTKDANGTYQQDMISASRIHEFVTIPIKSYADLFHEVSSGNPVIVFRNLGFDWVPLWHYSVITGYDNKDQMITMHSGEKQDQVLPLVEFDKSWSKANYWAFSILRPGQLSVNGEAIDYIKSAAAFENANKLKSAKLTYETILKKWPQNEIAFYAIGNVYFSNNNYQRALEKYEDAVRINPKFSEAWYNLAVTYKILKMQTQFEQASKMAIESANKDKKNVLVQKLKML